MLREALGYPTRSPEGGRSIILGGIALVFIAIGLGVATLDTPYAYLAAAGLFPWLLVRGYYVRVVRTTIGRDRPTPPRFDDVRQLLVDGMTAVWIALLYLALPVAVLAPLVAVQLFEVDLSRLLGVGAIPDPLSTVLISLVGLVAVGALMALLGALYVLPVAVARFAHSDEWRRAIEVRTVLQGALTEDYAIAWGVSFLIQALLLPLSYLLRVLLIGFLLQFVVAVGVRYCYGQGVGAAFDLDPVGTDPSEIADEDAKAKPSTETLPPAITRVDTAAWGISPGESSEPMPKSARFDGSDDGSSVGDRPASDEEDADETTLQPAIRRVSDGETAGER